LQHLITVGGGFWGAKPTATSIKSVYSRNDATAQRKQNVAPLRE